MSKIAGIYKIQRIGTDQCYVGSSVNIKERWRLHKVDLNRGKHHASRLQNVWTKYGIDAFAFSVIEECARDKSTLKEREQYWMDQLAPIFNTLRAAYSRLGYKATPETIEKLRLNRKGASLSAETRQKISDALKGVPKTAEHNIKVGLANAGRKHSPETVAKQREFRHTEASNEKNRLAHLGRKASPETIVKLKDKRMSDEAKAKISAKSKGRTHTPETIAKMKGRKPSPEAIEKLRAANIGRKHNAESIEKMRVAQTGKTLSAETKKKIGLAGLGRKNTPEVIEKMRQIKRSPEQIARVIATHKGRIKSPEECEKIRLNALARGERKRIERERPPPE